MDQTRSTATIPRKISLFNLLQLNTALLSCSINKPDQGDLPTVFINLNIWELCVKQILCGVIVAHLMIPNGIEKEVEENIESGNNVVTKIDYLAIII